MPYESTSELPDSVRENLPEHAQEIYKEAYNSASEQYDDEGTAHRVAWSAVKEEYEKQGDRWVKKESE